MQVRHQRLSTAVEVPRRLLDNTFTFAVAENVVFFASGCLSVVSLVERLTLPHGGALGPVWGAWPRRGTWHGGSDHPIHDPLDACCKSR